MGIQSLENNSETVLKNRRQQLQIEKFKSISAQKTPHFSAIFERRKAYLKLIKNI